MQVSVLLTNAGRQVVTFETGLEVSENSVPCSQQLKDYFKAGDNLQYCGINDFFASVASGSSAPDAVVICPCSMGTVGRIAAGLSGNLLERVADVALKENKTLLLVPRETPFNQIHLENLLRLTKAGAQILPAMPGFYQQPKTVADLIDFLVGKIMDSLGFEHQLFVRWGDEKRGD